MRTTQDLYDEVVSKIDHNNRETVTPTDILTAMNRGYDDAMDIIATRQEDMLLKHLIIPFEDLEIDSEGAQFTLIPEDCYQMRLVNVEARLSPASGWSKSQLINAQEANKYELVRHSTANNGISHYTMGRKIVFLPLMNGTTTHSIRLLYMQKPLSLVLPQGRVVSTNVSSGTIMLDELGPDLSMLVGDKSNFMNVINGQTGEVRGCFQVLSRIGTTSISIRSTPTRSTFQNSPVLGELPETIKEDDYICAATGTCIPFIDSPVGKMVVEYATLELEMKLGQLDRSLQTQITGRIEGKVKDLSGNRTKRFRVNCSAPWSRRL